MKGVLGKAQVDPFSYAVALADGWVFGFESLEIISEDSVLLLKPLLLSAPAGFLPSNAGLIFERGVEIALDKIVWCCDAPFGS